MFFWRVLIGSFLVDVIPADIIGVNFSGLALILLTQGVFNLCFLTQLNRIFKRRQNTCIMEERLMDPSISILFGGER